MRAALALALVLAVGGTAGAQEAQGSRTRSEAAGAAPDAGALRAVLRPLYPGLLRQAHAPFEPGTPKFDRALSATVDALLTLHRDGCPVRGLLDFGCHARSFAMSSTSMSPTVHKRELVVAIDDADGHPYERGDVVAFDWTPPGATKASTSLSRLIGLPGDRVAIRRRIVVLNGTPLPQSLSGERVVVPDLDGTFQVARESLPNGRSYSVLQPLAVDPKAGVTDDMPEVTVREGHYFFLGDNRSRAADSRYAGEGLGYGTPALADLVGRVKVITLSEDLARIGREP